MLLHLFLTGLEAEAQPLTAALEKLEQLEHLRRSFSNLEKAIAYAKANIKLHEQQSEQYQIIINGLRADIQRAQTMGSIRRLLSGLNPAQLAQKIITTSQADQAAKDAARALADEINRNETELPKIRSEISSTIALTREYPPVGELDAKLKGIATRIGELRERINVIDRELAALEQQVLSRCRILATTVYQTYIGKAPPRQFDVVIVDEASMLMLPLVYYAAGLATHAVTVAGDFRQLPPIVSSEEPLAAEWLKKDVFEKAGIPAQLENKQNPQYLVQLGTQYRMCKAICDVINKFFYHDRPLRSDPKVNLDVETFPLSKSPLIYVDTDSLHPWTALRVGSYSRYNMLHALLVRNIVLHLAEVGFLVPEKNDAVGAVAPYSSQARLIQALLEDRLSVRAAGISATVHRFQGNEKQVMIFDLTDSIGAPIGRPLQAAQMMEDGARLLNVALSRAKSQIVLLGNLKYLQSKSANGAIVKNIIEHFRQHGEALDLRSLLPLAEHDWIDGLHQMQPNAFDFPKSAAGAFTEGTFYPAFLNDLARVRESVVIFSPFATNAGTGRWVDPLRAAITRGVRVRLLTRPAEELGGGTTSEVRELVQALRDVGVVVDLRARMHEKIAILDNSILWHGSLNILSHRDTHESMLRIESPAACKQLARFVSTPSGRSEGVQSLTAAENPTCKHCGAPTVWNSGRFGVYYKCENSECNNKVSAHRNARSPQASGRSHKQRNNRQKSKITDSTDQACPAPGCNGHLIERSGRFGRFLGCSRYPACRHSESAQAVQ